MKKYDARVITPQVSCVNRSSEVILHRNNLEAQENVVPKFCSGPQFDGPNESLKELVEC